MQFYISQLQNKITISQAPKYYQIYQEAVNNSQEINIKNQVSNDSQPEVISFHIHKCNQDLLE